MVEVTCFIDRNKDIGYVYMGDALLKGGMTVKDAIELAKQSVTITKGCYGIVEASIADPENKDSK